MSGMTIRVKGLQEAIDSFNLSSPGAQRAVRAGLMSAGERAVVVLARAGRQKKAVNTGLYIKSWGHNMVGRAMTVGNMALRVFNHQPYAAVIEHGRRPGKMPPLAPIERWVHLKLRPKPKALTPRGKAIMKGRGVDTTMGARTKRLEASVAFAVARKIARKGTPARNVVGDVLDKLGDMAAKEVAHEIELYLSSGEK